jgi:hypothetical protein
MPYGFEVRFTYPMGDLRYTTKWENRIFSTMYYRASSFFLHAIMPLSLTVSNKVRLQRYGIMRSPRHGSVPQERLIPRASQAGPRTFYETDDMKKANRRTAKMFP